MEPSIQLKLGCGKLINFTPSNLVSVNTCVSQGDVDNSILVELSSCPYVALYQVDTSGDLDFGFLVHWEVAVVE